MASRSRFEINGVIDTSANVMENIELLATSAGCFVTWDPALGKWAVIVNEAGTSAFSFDDSNIIGSIAVTSSNINDIFNSVQVQYPHKNLRDTVDFLTVSIPEVDRFENELDNTLQINLNTINDPVQARLIASQELKQNRVDKVIEFQTDFTANGLKAGDIVDVTNTALDFSSKLFRIIQVNELDTDDGGIVYTITALEYDADVYTTTGLTYDIRTKNTGIPSKVVNEEIEAKDDQDAGAEIGRLLLANAAAGLFNGLISDLFGDSTGKAEGAFTEEEAKAAKDQQSLLSGAKRPPLTHAPSVSAICEGGSVTINFTDDCETCYFDVPDFDYPYEITGIDSTDIDIPLTGTVSIVNGSGSITFNTVSDGDSYETLEFACGENTSSIVIQSEKAFSYDSISASPSTSITEGDTVTVTINSTGITDGTTKNYEISGTASGKVTSPALTGTVTFNSNQATLTIVTNNDSVYTGGQQLLVEIDPTFENPCAVANANSITIDVADDESVPTAPGDPGFPDYSCDYVQVPIIWCGTYGGETTYLKSITVLKYAFLPKAPTGGTAVPLTVSVTNADTSSAAVSIDSTVNIDPTSLNPGGAQIDVITSFDPPPSGGDTLLTGTTATFNGYWS